jgi:hypothetical protein
MSADDELMRYIDRLFEKNVVTTSNNHVTEEEINDQHLYNEFTRQLVQLKQQYSNESDDAFQSLDEKDNVKLFQSRDAAMDGFKESYMGKKRANRRGVKRKMLDAEDTKQDDVKDDILDEADEFNDDDIDRYPSMPNQEATMQLSGISASVNQSRRLMLHQEMVSVFRQRELLDEQCSTQVQFNWQVAAFKARQVYFLDKDQALFRASVLQVGWKARLMTLLCKSTNAKYEHPSDIRSSMSQMSRLVTMYNEDGLELQWLAWQKRLSELWGVAVQNATKHRLQANQVTPGKIRSVLEVWDSEGCICVPDTGIYKGACVLYNYVASCGVFKVEPTENLSDPRFQFYEQEGMITRAELAAIAGSKHAPAHEQSGPTSLKVGNPGVSTRFFNKHRAAFWGARSCFSQLVASLQICIMLAQETGAVCIPYGCYNTNQMLTGFFGYLINIQKLKRICPFAIVDSTIANARMTIPGTMTKVINVWPTGKFCCYGVIDMELLHAVINFIKMYVSQCFRLEYETTKKIKIRSDGTPNIVVNQVDQRRSNGRKSHAAVDRLVSRVRQANSAKPSKVKK